MPRESKQKFETQMSRRRFLAAQASMAGMLTVTGASWAESPSVALSPTAALRQRFFDAVATGQTDEVRQILEADPGLAQARDEAGRTAFTVALLAGHAQVGALLESRGYMPDVHELALAGDWERFEPAARSAPGVLGRHHPVGGSAMFAAAAGGAGSQIWRVYQFGTDPNARPGGDELPSALSVALEHSDLQTAEMTAFSLLSNGADPNLPEPAGDSPLHVAARRGSWDLAEMLIRLGADVEAKNEAGARPLDLAEQHGHDAVADLLRRHREIARSHATSRRAYDVDGDPYRPPSLEAFATLSVQKAVGLAHFRFDELRLVVDADPKLVHAVAATTEGAVEACAHTGRTEIVDYLLERGAPYSLPTAVMRGDLGAVRRLLDEDPLRIHERGAHDFALLRYPVIGGGAAGSAANKQNVEMAELLLASGAEVEAQHQLGTTALHWAAGGGRLDLIELFLQHGADIDRRGRKFGGASETPLEAARGREQAAAVRLLIDRGAK